MTGRYRRPVALLLLWGLLAGTIQAQQTTQEIKPDPKERPQWLRDLRRAEIVAFGSFPFAMFTATMGMDLYRWQRANGMSWDDRSYAPWPLKSAGAVAMTDDEQKNTITLAIGLSLTVALVDHLIVRIRRQRERRRIEEMPAGTIIINRIPAESPADGDSGNGDSGDESPVSE